MDKEYGKMGKRKRKEGKKKKNAFYNFTLE
jgi:hypothetical protein